MTVAVEIRRRQRRDDVRRWLGRAGLVVLVAPMLLIIGAIAAGLHPLEAVVGVVFAAAVVGLIVAIMARPELGALAIFALVAVVPVDTLFEHDVAFLSGGLKITDLLLLVSLGTWTVARAVDHRPVRLPSRPLTALVVAFLIVALYGVFTARSSGVDVKLALLELRAILVLLLVFPIVDGVRRIEDLERALAVFLTAVALSAMIVTRDFILGRGSVALFSNDATRINNLVYVYHLAGIVWGLSLIPFVRSRTVRTLLLVLTGVCAAALFYASRRGGWIVALLAPLIVLALLPLHRWSRSGRRLLLMVGAVVGVILFANSVSTNPIESPLTSARERLFSLGRSDEDVSARHRVAELERARELIRDRPLAGIGLGASITFISPLYDPVAEESNVLHTNIYVHNSYIWVALKLGLPALAVFLALLGVAITEAYRGYTRTSDLRARRLMLGGVATLVALVLVALSEPHLTYVGSSPLLVGASALTQVVPRLTERPPVGPG
ncbi:MAG: O-antigen ligase family protein [Acidimicrobiales bacterium]